MGQIGLLGSATGSTAQSLYVNALSNIQLYTGATERMRIDSAGNVGIGTSSPGQRLDVTGSIRSSSTIIATATGQCTIIPAGVSGSWTGTGFAIQSEGGTAPIGFLQGASERMRIDSAGNVLIGKTTATANGGDLQVSSGITFPATQVPKSDANTLDDYEEGSWTPGLGGTWISNPTSLSGQYVKIGATVWLRISWLGGTKASATSAHFTGVPFSVLSQATAAVSNVSVVDYGNALVDGAQRVFLTANTFDATCFATFVYQSS
jgi:hypothetical protein